MTEELSVIDLIKIIFKHKLILLLTILLGIGISILYCFVIHKDEYQSTAKILLKITKENETVDYDYNNSFVMISTVSQLPMQSIILSKVSDKYDIPIEELMEMINVNNPKSSLVIEISCVSIDKNLSKNLANDIVDTLIEECINNEQLAIIGNSIIKTSIAQNGIKIKSNKLFVSTAIVIVFMVIGFVIIFIKYSLSIRKKEE